jgi:carboxyl-terminal processing protease
MLQQQIRLASAMLLLAGGAALFSACQPQQVDPTGTTSTTTTTGTGAVTNQEVNKWILDSMGVYYYWNDKIPASPNMTQTPDAFFNSILYTWDRTLRPDGDRFSWIQENVDDLKSSLQGIRKSTGFEFDLRLFPSGSQNVVGQVLYVLPNSPAARAGIKRGDIFNGLNGQTMTISNFQSILSALGSANNETYTFVTADLANRRVSNAVTKTLTLEQIAENPVFKDSVYTIGAKKIGYFVYNQFINGPSGFSDPTYDNQVDAVFAKFKAAGVNELVLDLRYNPGGSTTAARNLASLIGKGVTASEIFYRQELNKNIMAEYQRANALSQLQVRFTNKSQNIGANLNRVFVLTSDRTASASELIINGLKPFMAVQIVGDTTVGKNVGSITIEDERKPRRINWGLQPIIAKSFNKLGQSDYTGGFSPDQVIFEPLVLAPLGDIANEPLLRAAVARITGATGARIASERQTIFSIGSTLDRKAGGGNMFEPGLPKLK